ncbi:hypothetical protein [Amycolatopsis marina]|uniref:hypothetical protein n=1 Tax=Amycolatopsis marina TaxID=490629 RepID=UPI0011604F58|nr:hypothetical protein [Amycolatopsis marina]
MNSTLPQAVMAAFQEAAGRQSDLIPPHVIYRLAAIIEGQEINYYYLRTETTDDGNVSGSAIVFSELTVNEARWSDGSAARFQSSELEPVDVTVWPRRNLRFVTIDEGDEVNPNEVWLSEGSSTLWPRKSEITLHCSSPDRQIKFLVGRAQPEGLTQFIRSLHQDLAN